MIKKILGPSLEKIKSINSTVILTMQVENELLNGYDIEIQKIEKGFTAKVNFKPYKGFSTSQLNTIKLPAPIQLHNDISKYYLPENSLLLNQYSSDWNNDEPLITINGGITQLSTAEEENIFNNTYLRLLVPIKDKKPKLKEIQGYYYETEIAAKERHLIKVVINAVEYHFFGVNVDAVMYLGVDTTVPFTIEDFRKLSHSILNGFGFLFGDLFLDDGYILSSHDADFSQIENAYYSTYRETMLTGLGIYTTNPFSIYNVTGKRREEIEARIEEVKSWYERIIEINPDWFSTLCELFYNCEPISRAAIITLQGNMFALEMKGSAYSAALEAITTVILKENKAKYPKPIDDKVLFNALRTKFFEALDSLLPAANPDNETSRRILSDRINNINKPTNASKLQKSFEVLGYTLKPYELAAIKARDKFQHGELPVDEITNDAVFREVYYICLIMHRLIYILILKRIRFEGYIINYPQLHSHITNTDLGEDLFYKI